MEPGQVDISFTCTALLLERCTFVGLQGLHLMGLQGLHFDGSARVVLCQSTALLEPCVTRRRCRVVDKTAVATSHRVCVHTHGHSHTHMDMYTLIQQTCAHACVHTHTHTHTLALTCLSERRRSSGKGSANFGSGLLQPQLSARRARDTSGPDGGEVGRVGSHSFALAGGAPAARPGILKVSDSGAPPRDVAAGGPGFANALRGSLVGSGRAPAMAQLRRTSSTSGMGQGGQEAKDAHRSPLQAASFGEAPGSPQLRAIQRSHNHDRTPLQAKAPAKSECALSCNLQRILMAMRCGPAPWCSTRKAGRSCCACGAHWWPYSEAGLQGLACASFACMRAC